MYFKDEYLAHQLQLGYSVFWWLFPCKVSSEKHKHGSYNISVIFWILDLYKFFPLSMKNLFLMAIIISRRMKNFEAVMISPSYTRHFVIKVYFGWSEVSYQRKLLHSTWCRILSFLCLSILALSQSIAKILHILDITYTRYQTCFLFLLWYLDEETYLHFIFAKHCLWDLLNCHWE